MLRNIPKGKGSLVKPRKRRLYEAGNYLKKKDVSGLTKIAKNRDARKLILKKAWGLHGPYSQ